MRREEGRTKSMQRTSYGSPVHDLELSDRLALVVLVRRRPSCFAADDGELHVLDFDAYKQEVYLANDHVLQVIPVQECYCEQ